MQFKNQLNHTNLFLIFSTHSGWNIISLIDMFWDKSRDQYLKILSMCFLGEDLRHFLCWKLTSVWPKLAEKMFYNFLNNLTTCSTHKHLKASSHLTFVLQRIVMFPKGWSTIFQGVSKIRLRYSWTCQESSNATKEGTRGG